MTTFEQLGGTYSRVGDYYLPDLALPEETRSIGIYGERHNHYLKTHKKSVYMELLTSGRLHSYLADINEQAEERLELWVKQMAETEGVTEKLKTDNQMEWVGRMTNIRTRAEEIVCEELIYN